MAYTKPYDGEVKYVKQEGVLNPTRHYLFITWRMMNVRCYDDRHKAYHRYGGRGVYVCEQWRWDNPLAFYNFINEMGDRPESYTLDRINNDGCYCRDNCKWSSKREQQNNLGVGLNNKSGILGVSWSDHVNGWVVQIQLNGEGRNIGHFNKEHEHLAKERYEYIKSIKMEKGDDAALDECLRLKILTPKGKSLRRNKTSKYYGVARQKGTKWRAFTNEYVNGKLKQIHLGVYEDEEEAYTAVLNRLNKTKV